MDIVALLAVIIGPAGLSAIVSAFFTNRKVKAETKSTEANAVEILTNTSVKLLGPMEKQIEFLTKQLSNTNEQLIATNERLVAANDQISELNETVQTLTDKLRKYENDLGTVLD